jgi:mono/diheme cytochrome c family protein
MSMRKVLIVAALAGCYHREAQPAPANIDPAPPAPVVAKPPPPPDPLAQQLERGKALFGAHCATCHGDHGEGDLANKAPPLVGKDAFPLDARPGYNREVKFRTAADVLWWVTKEMPGDDPGSLAVDEYIAIIAFDLSANGVALERPLDPAMAQLIALH